MPAPIHFAAQAPDAQEQLRPQGLEMLWDPITRRRLLDADLETAIALLEDQAITIVTPTLFGAVASRPL